MAHLGPVTIGCTAPVQIHSIGGIHVICVLCVIFYQTRLAIAREFPYILVCVDHITEPISLYVLAKFIAVFTSDNTLNLPRIALVTFVLHGPLFSGGVHAVPRVVAACTEHILMGKTYLHDCCIGD